MLAGEVYKLLEGTANAAFVVSLESEIVFWNRAAERLFGYQAAEVLGKTCHSILQGRGALGTFVCGAGCSAHDCAAGKTEVPNFDLEVVTKPGQPLWVSVSTIVFADSRTGERLVAHLAHDISERKKIEEAFTHWLEFSKEALALGNGQPHLAPVTALSEQEKRILRLFAKAKNSGQVAKELGITLPTVRNHLSAINQKLRTHNRLEAVLHAMKRGLI